VKERKRGCFLWNTMWNEDDGPLLASLWRRLPTASAFGQQSPTFHATSSAQHLRPSGVICCWTNGLELTAWWPTWSQNVLETFSNSR